MCRYVANKPTQGIPGPYFALIPIQDRFKETCQNEALIIKGSYTMKKSRIPGKSGQWMFEAIYGTTNEILSTLKAKEGGNCNDENTEYGSWYCGLGPLLLEICFDDPDIGTFIPDKSVDSEFGMPIDKPCKHLMEINCQHIAYLECVPYIKNYNDACGGYLTAALNTLHTMMFTKRVGIKELKIIRIADAKIKIKNDPDKFVGDFGKEWFFCKCKSDRIKECESMTNDDNDQCIEGI